MFCTTLSDVICVSVFGEEKKDFFLSKPILNMALNYFKKKKNISKINCFIRKN